jgi:hypothetical protein
MSLFHTDYCVIAYVDLETARRWWINIFGCKQVKVPDAWDDSMPEDVALRLPGAETATILICRAPARAEQRPILFTSNIGRARTHLVNQGIKVGSFEICLDT